MVRSYWHVICVAVLLASQPNGVMLSVVSLPNHTVTGQACNTQLRVYGI